MYDIMAKDASFTPAEFTVYAVIAHYPNCGFKPTEKMIARLGAAKTAEQVSKLIADDKRAMGDTYGGLIEPVRLKGRTYKVFKSAGWEEVK